FCYVVGSRQPDAAADTTGAGRFMGRNASIWEGFQVRRPATALAILATLIASFGGVGSTGSARAADLADVGGWATLGSVTPGAGCAVDANVEVRRDGFDIGGVDVAVDLVHDGAIQSSDAG